MPLLTFSLSHILTFSHSHFLRRFSLHIAFWLSYWFIYAYTYSRYDGNFAKYALSEGIQMPMRMGATYAAIWIMERFVGRGKSWAAFSGVAVANVAGGMLNRLIKGWWVVPHFFPDATYHFWDLSRMVVDIFDCVLASGAALTARLYFRQQEGLRREAQLRSEKLGIELQALKNQVNPHFLFNTINNLYGLARAKSEQTAVFALKLAGLLRYVLYESAKPQVRLEQEIQNLQDYVALEKIRFDEDRLRVDIQVDIDHPEQPVSPLLLLPLVENAFKHGVSESREAAWINIHISLKNNVLEVRVENSKPSNGGMEATVYPGLPNLEVAKGLGLANLRRQLELLYPGRHEIRVEDGEGRYGVWLRVGC